MAALELSTTVQSRTTLSINYATASGWIGRTGQPACVAALLVQLPLLGAAV
jgi:hypothetical protein